MNNLRSLLLAAIILSSCIEWASSRHHKHISRHRSRHRRNGAKLYLPASYILPGGEGSGAWSEWEEPSPCSRTCGGGVAYQKRICLDVGPEGQSSCTGGDKKYFSCNTQDCPDSFEDFRDQQCSEQDSTPFKGVSYQWVPYTKGPNPCLLQCMPKAGRFYYHFGQVADGTRCYDESFDVCVDGVCQPVGCDMMLGSKAREDKCRQCRGNNTNCITLEDTISTDGLIEGYNDILLIPKGATNINIFEEEPSDNYLALRGKEIDQYYLNGRYHIDFPKSFFIGGSTWHYERSKQGFAAPDKLKCLGPTTEPLYLSVLVLQPRSVNIIYEYSVPTALAPPPNVQYNWVHEDFTPCSAACGGGYQTREVTCRTRDELELAEEHLCDIQLKPAINQSCSTQACPPQWMTGEWSPCDKPCGSGGLQNRTVKCEKIITNGSPNVVDDDVCIKQLGEKPDVHRKCNVNDSCPTWFVGPWLPCDHLCDEGKQTRQVVCHQHVDGKVEVYDDGQCGEEKPPMEQECMIRPCEGVDWVVTEWHGCDSCLSKIRTRTAKCATKDKVVVNATFCEYHPLPVLEEECDRSKLPACQVLWYATQWSNCSVQCGNGTQSRRVFCGAFDGTTVGKVDDERCAGLEKYKDTKTCEIPEDKCPADWHAGPWSACTKECGGGQRFRRVMCLSVSNIVSEARCDPETILDSTSTCNTGPCDKDEMLPVDASATTIMDDDYYDDDCDEDYSEVGAEEDDKEDTSFTAALDMMFSDSPSPSDYTEEGSGMSTQFTETDITETGSGLDTLFTESVTSDTGSGETETTESFGSTESTLSGGTEESSESSATDISTTEVSGSTDSSDTTESTNLSTTESTDITGSSESSDGSTKSTDDSSESSDGSTTEVSTSESGTTEEVTTEFSTSDSSTIESTTEYSTTESSTSDATDQSTTEGGSTTDNASTTEDSSTTDGVTGLSTTDSTDLTSDSSEGSTTESSTGSSESAATDITSTDETGTTESGSTDLTGSTEATETTESGATETSGPTETTEFGSTETSGATETEATETTQTGETDETGSTEATETTWDGSSTTEIDSTDYSTTEDTSTWDWSSTIDEFTTKKRRMCKPRKSAKCKASKFGCCPDGKTSAAGPFAEGCPTPKTCKETKHGCCPDDVTPAAGPKNKGCTTIDCKLTLYGCCKSDGKSAAEGNDDKGCPPPPPACSKTKFGCCKDNKTEATGPKKKGCPETATKPPTTKSKGGSCLGSKFGCCPDNSTEATGPDGKGCPCDASEFGCCPDGTTKATGPELEGCMLSCNTSAFGCCADGTTPAHGPGGEGCCLLYNYGCCPDNYKPAEGPHLEGCGCQYSYYGCCPDNVTIARGQRNEGCGCQYTEHGCCPDRHTEASGPDFEGCGCNTYQFGCCPDGKTRAKGPSLQGCHCRDSEFGCCGDGVTPAQGPEQGGCDCSSSKFGCCPDGVTAAEGDKFLNCTDAPENRQEACGLSTDRGSCRNFTVKWFFDMEYGGCSRFWYGGCEGNGNRFGTKEECEDTCVQPPPKDACKLPKVKGVCQGYNLRWYYDNAREHCAQFIYGGCIGNANNFESRELCQEQCEPNRSEGQCKLPLERGSCAGNFLRWGYNDESGRCEQFIWGGCEGNSNRFGSEEACIQRCNAPGTLKEHCLLPQQPGNCTEKRAKWSFSQAENRCVPFYYTGCHGNRNKFDYREHCEDACPSAFVKELCTLPADVGNCDSYREKWYYDTGIKRCRQFYYGGCGGNSNNFASEQECQRRCNEDPVTTTTVRPPAVAPTLEDHCYLELDSGPCDNNETRWGFDSRRGRCVHFNYGGCGGNKNNYPDEKYCEYYCRGVIDVCQQPMSAGPCDDNQMKWFYDTTTDSCSQFSYGGCHGNDNRFETREECERRCRTGPQVQTTPAYEVQTQHEEYDVPNECRVPSTFERCQSSGNVWYYDANARDCVVHYNDASSGSYCKHTNVFSSPEKCERTCGRFKGLEICRYPVDKGPCNDVVTKFYFNEGEHRCEQFTYGGCHGGPNIFSTIEECQDECGVQEPEPVDVCQLTPDVGPCRASMRMWYYNSQRDTCAEFIYGGCHGNDNRFETREDCERRCKRIPDTTTVAASHYEAAELDVECRPNPENEPCGVNITAYYYDGRQCVSSQIGNCPYHNRYGSEEECLRRCGNFAGLDVCRYALDAGPCKSIVPKVYFDIYSGTCKEFTYGGCEGSPNRFSTIQECEYVCKDRKPGPECREPVSVGDSCPILSTRRWYYSVADGECVSFIYTGCGGNNNNFASARECEEACVPDDNTVDCFEYNEECARLQCEHGIERVQTADSCECCVCRTDRCDSYKRECAELNCDIVQSFTNGCIKCSCREDRCEQFKNECKELESRCPYGLQKSDYEGCERCGCLRDPCENTDCADGERCVVSQYRDPRTQEIKWAGDCKIVTKPGTCPSSGREQADCRIECNDDADCHGAQKCCNIACSRSCVTPIPELFTNAPTADIPQAPQASIETAPEIHSEEGGRAVLRCFFHGNPPPKITWTKGELTIDGTSGRYRINSDGALEIVSLYRNDSGVYICVADNVHGQARQEINLQVTDPTTVTEAGISGDDNAVVIGDLGRSLAIRCLPYGHPKPTVAWYKDATMVPYDSQQYEARDNILLIRSLSIDSLGMYVCQAYNGKGKPASWTVTVQAYRNNPHDDSPYLIDREGEDYVPRPWSPHTVEVPTQPPTQTPEPEIPIFTVPVKTSIKANKYVFENGATLSLLCDVNGYPLPTVSWSKDNNHLYNDERIYISEAYRLTITNLSPNDSGNYQCHAANDYSSDSTSVAITVQGSGYIPESCTDSPYFANCKLIVRSKFCHHPYYSGFCCRSCIESGQLSVEELPNYNLQYSKK